MIDLQELVKAIEKHVDLTYTDYDRDRNGDEYAVERVNALPDIIKDLEKSIEKANKEFDRYMTAVKRLAQEGIKDGSLAVIKDVHIGELHCTDIFILGGKMRIDGDGTFSMIAAKRQDSEELDND